jgi:hypothetical protein
MSPHLVMQARKKSSIQQVSETGFGARIGAIERKWPGFPAKPNHGAPFHRYCVLFGYEHADFSCHTTAFINASAGSPPKPANALGGAFPPASLVTSDKPPLKPVSRGAEVLPALKRSNKRPQKYQNRASF